MEQLMYFPIFRFLKKNYFLLDKIFLIIQNKGVVYSNIVCFWVTFYGRLNEFTKETWHIFNGATKIVSVREIFPRPSLL